LPPFKKSLAHCHIIHKIKLYYINRVYAILGEKLNMEKNMTVATLDDFTSQLTEFDKIQDTCKKLMATKHYSTIGEAGIHAIMARAKTLHIHPFCHKR
jgi:hypothetical protein